MALLEIMQQAREIAEQIGVKTVYGEPVVSGDKTVVPVASVAFGGGGGGGRAHDPERGKGGGGGFGLRGWPAGYIEITPAGTRYVPVVASPKLAAAVLLGFAAGYILARLQRR